jgi:hypothetical protein
MIAQGDVLLFQAADGGNIIIENNQDVQLTGGFETDFYLSLFGGNQEDDGSINNKNNWWGNLMEDDPAFQFRSRTQNLLISLPLVSGNLRKIEDAIKNDLKSYIDIGAISELSVDVSITGPRRVEIIITALANGKEINLAFLANWQAMEKEFTVKKVDEAKSISDNYTYKYLTNENDDILTTENDDQILGLIKDG